MSTKAKLFVEPVVEPVKPVQILLILFHLFYLLSLWETEAGLYGPSTHGTFQHLVKAEITDTGMSTRQDDFVDSIHKTNYTEGCGISLRSSGSVRGLVSIEVICWGIIHLSSWILLGGSAFTHFTGVQVLKIFTYMLTFLYPETYEYSKKIRGEWGETVVND